MAEGIDSCEVVMLRREIAMLQNGLTNKITKYHLDIIFPGSSYLPYLDDLSVSGNAFNSALRGKDDLSLRVAQVFLSRSRLSYPGDNEWRRKNFEERALLWEEKNSVCGRVAEKVNKLGNKLSYETLLKLLVYRYSEDSRILGTLNNWAKNKKRDIAYIVKES